jgi:hypothetical protein
VNHSGLTDGRWQIFVETLDWSGNWGYENFTLLLDRKAPTIEWVTPMNNSTIWNHKVPVSWNISEISDQSLTIDGVVVSEFSTGDLTMQTEVKLDETGWHQLCLLASDLTVGPSANVVTDCMKEGLLINCIQQNTIRFLPPLIITRKEIDLLITTLSKIFTKMQQ